MQKITTLEILHLSMFNLRGINTASPTSQSKVPFLTFSNDEKITNKNKRK